MTINAAIETEVPVPPAVPASGAGPLASNAPPLRLPGEHFAAALAFWVLGAAGVVWVSPDLARGLFPLPRVVAVAHFFTLGWITTTIQGALYQFLPVALLTPIRSERAAHVSFVLYVPGLATFIAGLVLVNDAVLVAGAAVFATGLLVFVANLGVTLARCRERGLTWWALAGAATSLLSTVVLGISLAGNFRWGYIGADRFLAVGVHMHVAVAGWVMLVMVGVASRLLPMFLVSHGASERPGRVAVVLLAAGVAALLAFHHALSPRLTWAIAASLAGGVAAFVVQAALYFRHRRRPRLDPGLRLAAAGLAFLCAGVALAPVVVARGVTAPNVATAYALALVVGGASLFVAGHYYKILPFLIWFHRFGPLVGKRPVPNVAGLYSARLGNASATLLIGGTGGLVVAPLLTAPVLARWSAALFAAGATILAIQMFLLSRTRPS